MTTTTRSWYAITFQDTETLAIRCIPIQAPSVFEAVTAALATIPAKDRPNQREISCWCCQQTKPHLE